MPVFRSYKRKSYGKASRAGARASATRSGRAGAVAAARKTNTAVKRALRRPTRALRNVTTPSRNKNAIVTLSRQVRELQMKHYGDVQYTRQVLCRNTGTKDIIGNGTFMAGSPFLFELKNFFNGALVFRGDMTSNNTPAYIQDNKWLALSEVNASGAGRPYVFDVPNDAVSHTQYMPLSAYYAWHVKFWNVDPGKDKIVRLSVFKLKTSLDNSKIKTALPDYLGQYANMCMEDPSDRNKFSPVYHQVLYERTYHVRNTGDTSKDIEQYFNLKWSFSRKDGLIRLDTDQIEGQVNLELNDPLSTKQAYCAANFGHLVKPEDQLYVLLSTSNSDTGQKAEISCMRTLRWRDNEGVISI